MRVILGFAALAASVVFAASTAAGQTVETSRAVDVGLSQTSGVRAVVATKAGALFAAPKAPRSTRGR